LPQAQNFLLIQTRFGVSEKLPLLLLKNKTKKNILKLLSNVREENVSAVLFLAFLENSYL
jgi:hypothetical protein